MAATGLAARPARNEEDGVAEGALRQRRVTPRADADRPVPSGCGGRRPSAASLLLDVPVCLVRLRRRSWHLAAWRSQRDHVGILLGALRLRNASGHATEGTESHRSTPVCSSRTLRVGVALVGFCGVSRGCSAPCWRVPRRLLVCRAFFKMS
jgi:hypothetical protein